eukprot:GHRR01014532.1.p2 GENE.GHRR01014532.1~~GHRR01014532.1.p2  ORF type:complete len:148 (+),score=54.49 GHRR01014532.1:2109-2552(+)
MGQSVLELLAAYSMAQYPADFMITEGYTCHIMRIRGKKIIFWRDLTPGQAVHHLANFLQQVDCSVQVTASHFTATHDEGREALEYLRRYHPLATVFEQAEQLMELDDGSSRVQQALNVMRLMRQQHGDNAIAALAAPPPSVWQHIYS